MCFMLLCFCCSDVFFVRFSFVSGFPVFVFVVHTRSYVCFKDCVCVIMLLSGFAFVFVCCAYVCVYVCPYLCCMCFV